MKKNILFILLIGLIVSLSCKKDEPVSTEKGDALDKDGWHLIWHDEFDTDGLPDSKKWNYDVGGHGWGNQELQYYSEDRLQNARVDSGVLIIEARKEWYEGSKYTSARLVTKGKGDWLYGRFEVRAKLPTGRGTWPAIWMLPTVWSYGNGSWPDNGEIDIMEHVGYDPGVVHATVHTKDYNHSIGTQVGQKIDMPDATAEFHTYTVEWNADSIMAYVDETKYFSFKNEGKDYATWPFDKEFHLILNIAVGGSWGAVQGVDDSIFPQKMEVDFVRVYKRE